MNVAQEYLRVVKDRFMDMKKTAEKAMEQLSDDQLFHTFNEETNSVAVIVKHMSGNMISRWTNFFHSDGEKPNRNRDDEFINEFTTRDEVLICLEKGWHTFLTTLNTISESDLLRTVTIRHEPHSVIEAIERQMYHYSYHIGQIVYIAKQLTSTEWKTLTIPRKKG
ncbi:DinB family protein [Anoxybacillus rupiensis]|uniref:DinB family protein n=1 Tax=Anoxybacteroides rupiense TaxID=311460 RepID=A0ABD5IUK4_9BACL|nr:DinB family protein [Anoxybacillus rupiensis]